MQSKSQYRTSRWFEHLKNSLYNYNLFRMIVYNLMFLIVTNTFLPYLPLPPQIFLPLPFLTTGLWREKSAFELLHLNRLHNETELKASFRDAMKEYHPDRGGDANVFNHIRNLKTVMTRQEGDLYDTMGIQEFTNTQSAEQTSRQIQNQKLIFTADLFMFYLVAFVFMLGLTMHPDHRHLRKYIFLALFFTLGQELFAFYYPKVPTVLDLIFPKMPLFQQSVVLRDLFSILLVIIRITDMRKKTEQKTLIQNLHRYAAEDNTAPIVQNLQKLQQLYTVKLDAYVKDEASWTSQLRRYVSKGLSILFIVAMVSSLVMSGRQ